jgi:hypothetical protein
MGEPPVKMRLAARLTMISELAAMTSAICSRFRPLEKKSSRRSSSVRER